MFRKRVIPFLILVILVGATASACASVSVPAAPAAEQPAASEGSDPPGSQAGGEDEPSPATAAPAVPAAQPAVSLISRQVDAWMPAPERFPAFAEIPYAGDAYSTNASLEEATGDPSMAQRAENAGRINGYRHGWQVESCDQAKALPVGTAMVGLETYRSVEGAAEMFAYFNQVDGSTQSVTKTEDGIDLGDGAAIFWGTRPACEGEAATAFLRLRRANVLGVVFVVGYGQLTEGELRQVVLDAGKVLDESILAETRSTETALAGERIAFVSNRSGAPGVYTINPDGSGLVEHKIDLSGEGFINAPTWSRDGNWLAVQITPAMLGLIGVSDNSFKIYRLPEERQETDCPSYGEAENCAISNYTYTLTRPAWSPGGFAVFFTGIERISYGDPRMDPSRFYSIRLETIHPADLEARADPQIDFSLEEGSRSIVWSPRGDFALVEVTGYDALRGNYAYLDIVDMAADRTSTLVPAQWQARTPAWSPDGQRIAFVTSKDGDDEIYVMDVASTELRPITDNDVSDRDPTWSPDGQRIAFCSDRDGNQEVYVMNADGSGAVNLTRAAGEDCSPNWSPGAVFTAGN